ncbi:MAG: biotin/lipoyl-binding protein [Acidimicrobiia bacterium]|nr:biotin/lipoyl-binding protein [Acidimicrobiia bacterium]
MITKLLVANRGEIARRVFRTARAMGISTVAIFSDPDSDAPFVAEADEAIAIGGASPADSYLRVDAVLDAARRAGADALHPGYGFLAENADFAQAVIDAGLTWVGPSPAAIRSMGSKLESKRLMVEAGVPTLASVDVTGMEPSQVAEAGLDIGYPILVKASAGGGGKGMRIVRDAGDLVDAVAGARREAASAFGDDTVFLERYLDAPRHVEIQVFGDSLGNIVSLFERECSIQRRHQKIVEESPSPAVDEDLRRRMGEAAVAAARAVDYVGAGTVEFLLQDGEFSFLEMNTRLQVEHPVTELITGLDLVRLQLLVAQGAPLPSEALSPTITGHAIEVRLYAEDAANSFLPVTGTIHRFRFPEMTGLRVDSGVEDGSEISVHYDPMLAKVIVWAPTRVEAAATLASALSRAEIQGSITNRNLLANVLRHPEFVAGATDTHFLERHDPAGLAEGALTDGEVDAGMLAAALAAGAERRLAQKTLSTIPWGWRNSRSKLEETTFGRAGSDHVVGYGFRRDGTLLAAVDGRDLGAAALRSCTPNRVTLDIGGHVRTFDLNRRGLHHYVTGPSGEISLIERDRFPAAEIEDEPGSLHAPMPGKVLEVRVSEGDAVAEGDVLVIMEAMKMEHTLRAPFGGTVHHLRVASGDQVEADQVLVVVEED